MDVETQAEVKAEAKLQARTERSFGFWKFSAIAVACVCLALVALYAMLVYGPDTSKKAHIVIGFETTSGNEPSQGAAPNNSPSSGTAPDARQSPRVSLILKHPRWAG